MDDLQFLTQEQRAELIKLYIAFFNRAPEFQGLEFHATKVLEDMNNGLTFEEALTNRADVFFDAGLLFPSSGYSLSQTMEEFVETMYANVLLRPGAGGDAPTQAEVSYWVSKLTSGEITRGEMAQQMLAAVDTLIDQGTAEEQEISQQVQDALNNRVAVAEAFAQPDISGNLTGDAAVQAGIAALQGVTSDPDTIQPAIDAFTKPPQTFIYTHDADDFQGGDGDDLFVAGDSALFASNPLQPGDMADGGGGTNQLDIIDDGGSQIIPDISNIQNVFINGFSLLPGLPVIVNFQNSSGVEQIWNDRSYGDIDVDDTAVVALNIQDNVILGTRQTMTNWDATFAPGAIDNSDNPGVLNTLWQDAGTYTGVPESDDEAEEGEDADLDIDLGGNTVDTLNIWSNGVGAGNHIDIDITNNGGTLTHVNILPGPLADTLGERPINAELDGDGFEGLTNVDATQLSEDLILDVDESDLGVTIDGGTGNTTIFSGSGADTITTQDGDDYIDDEGADNGPQLIQTNGGNDQVILNGSDNTVLLGDGDDLLDSENSELNPDDSYDGGDGFDMLALDVDNAIAATDEANDNDEDLPVTNFERLILRGTVDNDIGEDVWMNTLGGINDVTLQVDVDDQDLDLEEMKSGGTVRFELTGDVASDGNINIDGPSSDGVNDEFNFIINTTFNVFGEVDLNDVETLYITNEGTTEDHNIRFDMDLWDDSLDVPGGHTNDIILDGVAGLDLTGSDLDGVKLFDATGVTGTGELGRVEVIIGNDDENVTILGGAGDDLLVSTGAGDYDDDSSSNDVITGNAGADVIFGGLGADVLTGDGLEVGSFTDTFEFTDQSQSNEVNGVDTITDFETGVDLLSFDFDVDYIGEFADAVAARLAVQNGGPGAAAFNAADGLLYINEFGPYNPIADYTIRLDGVTDLDQADFILV